MIRGSQVGSNQFLATSNQFIISKIDARNGAYGIVPSELDKAIVTGDFLLFDPSNSLDISFLNYFANTTFFDFECKKASEGTTNRVRLRIEKFLQIEIPLPSLAEQQRIAGRLSVLKEKMDTVRRLRGEQGKEMQGLLFSQYQKVIEGADWRPMWEVAPLERRKVDLQPNTVYQEIAVRSFGRGVFEKADFNSDDLTWEKPNWIKEGDLLMSNIKAWEGAVAPVGKEHDGKVGSHRYLTFAPNPEITSAEFLAFYFSTDKGRLQLNEASPGTADRNRTLNTKTILNALVPVPNIALQNDFLQLQTKIETLKAAQSEQMKGLEGLFPSVLEQAFRGDW